MTIAQMRSNGVVTKRSGWVRAVLQVHGLTPACGTRYEGKILDQLLAAGGNKPEPEPEPEPEPKPDLDPELVLVLAVICEYFGVRSGLKGLKVSTRRGPAADGRLMAAYFLSMKLHVLDEVVLQILGVHQFALHKMIGSARSMASFHDRLREVEKRIKVAKQNADAIEAVG